MSLYEKFTEQAQKAIGYAQDEAVRLGASAVDTEHLLLGLVSDVTNSASRLLHELGVSPSRVHAEVRYQLEQATKRRVDEGQVTPRARRALELAYDEARLLGREDIDTEHVLLGLLREGNSMACRVLESLQVNLERARAAVRPSRREATSAPIPVPLRHNPAIAGLRGRDLLSIEDLSSEECSALLQLAADVKKATRAGEELVRWRRPHLLAMVFEKPSLRTRFTFEAAMVHLGGHAIYLSPSEIGLGKRESVPDVARNLERWCQVVMARVFSHQTLVELAQNAQVPVINALSDLEHPCQALADFQTLIEHRGDPEGKHLVFVGDGNNVANSLMLLSAKLGTHFTIACPPGYEPDARITARAREIASDTGSEITITHDPVEAVRTADAIYTDVWASMGQEHEAQQRRQVFLPYQVNAELMKKAQPSAMVMHCLPAHRGEEITDEVIDGPQSVVFDQAENRMHAQKAVLAALVGDW